MGRRIGRWIVVAVLAAAGPAPILIILAKSVIVMSGGRLAWAGSVEDARDYFATASPIP